MTTQKALIDMIPVCDKYEDFELNLALSHIFAAEEDNRVYQSL